MTQNAGGPIGVFDSGVGGLTVLREIAARVPAELVYLGDCARVPYGSKSAETVTRYSLEAADFLMKRGISMLVVACNTATAHALGRLRSELTIPVIGVIEPGARAAGSLTRGRVGVIATEGTVRSHAYRDALHAISPDLEVFELACPLFVPLIEEGWANTRVAREIVETYLAPLLDEQIDTLVLGCTHYPLLRPTIESVTRGRIHIVDSAQTTAETVAQIATPASGPVGPPHFYVTDAEERFARIAGEFLERPCDRLELVTLD